MERLLQRDGIVRILSILLAVILWYQVSGSQSAEETRKYGRFKLTVVNPNEDMEVLSLTPLDVEISATGPRRNLDRVSKDLLRATVDLTNFKVAGPQSVPVMVEGLSVPGVVATPQPDKVQVMLEKRLTRDFTPLLPETERVVGDTRYRWAFKEARPTVKVTGYAPDANRVSRVEAKVDLSGVEEDRELLVPVKALEVDGTEAQKVTVQPQQVAVSVRVEKLDPAKELPIRPKFSGTLPNGYTFSMTVTPATTKVRGPQARHRDWTEVATEPVNLTGQTSPFTVQAGLVKPDGAASMDLAMVTVVVNILEVREDKFFRNVKLELWHLAANLEAQQAVNEVTVRLFGPKRLLDTLNPSILAVNLEAQDLGPGKHFLPVRITRPEGIEVLNVEPATVEVTIVEKKPATN